MDVLGLGSFLACKNTCYNPILCLEYWTIFVQLHNRANIAQSEHIAQSERAMSASPSINIIRLTFTNMDISSSLLFVQKDGFNRTLKG